jgi:CRISPR/Cas system-associated endonuclease Cas1
MFRAPVVDRTVISLITKGHDIKLNNRGWLTDGSRRKMAAGVLDRLHTYVRFRSKNSRTLAEIIDYTAKDMGKYLKGEINKFYPFISKW